MNHLAKFLRKKQVRIGIIIYAVVFFAVILIANLQAINSWIASVLDVLSPVLIGLVIAYLGNPFFRFFERKLLFHLRPTQLRRILSLLLTYIVLFSIVAGLLLLIIPQLFSSVWDFIQKFESHLVSATDLANGFISSLNASLPPKADGSPAIALLNAQTIMTGLENLLKKLPEQILKFFESDAINPDKIINSVMGIVTYTTTLITDIIFGIFVSIYLLASKEKRYAQIMRFRRAYLSDNTNRILTRICTVADNSFGAFLRGKMVDSAIVGLLVYLTCLIFNIPYAVLVAVIVGITDIIPVIGPFIGVIPSAIIILLTDPVKVIIFVIAILVIQQLDGNVIAPKILGEHTGVSSLCIMIAILVMGDLMGLVGMLIGVPLFATVIELGKGYLHKRLAEKGIQPKESDASPEPTEQPTIESIPAPAFPSNGNLTSMEQMQLRVYALAKQHHLFADTSDEALSAFADEAAELFFAADHSTAEATAEEASTVDSSESFEQNNTSDTTINETSEQGGEEA